MIRMILADDEAVITRGIQKLIDWNSLGIEVVGEYSDGRRAFEGIVQKKPELALLDISMPQMTGIEILKECNELGIDTKIIFISGFQDFEYAQNAVKYGAVDYILKPVIREELLSAIENGMALGRKKDRGYLTQQENAQGMNYSELIQLEDTDYVPVFAQILYRSDIDSRTRKLIQFSFAGFLESYLKSNHMGITFEKNENVVIVLKVQNTQEVKPLVIEIWQKAVEATGQNYLFIIGQKVEQMSQIAESFEKCLSRKGYLFFAEQISTPVIQIEESVFQPVNKERMVKVIEGLLTTLLKKDETGFENQYLQFQKLVCRISNGKKEDACYYFCDMIRNVHEKLMALGCDFYKMEMQELLAIGRRMEAYAELVEAYHSILVDYMRGIQHVAQNSEKSTFIQAKEYIEQHYTEDITLNLVADQIHMNPYYFSVFFKKNAGENYKTYLSKIRLEHAIKLLVSTNKKTYEIAVEVGFTDARSFTETFQKYFKETPHSYRKGIRKK